MISDATSVCMGVAAQELLSCNCVAVMEGLDMRISSIVLV
jgi:hypothetical protein